MNHKISPQYITKDKITVTILDMVDPSHFVVKETADLSNPHSKAKNFLEVEEAMQKFYDSVEPCFFQLPLKDAIVVVYHDDKFFRARVIRILTMSVGHLFRVYLVDYGIECSIPREKIYEIEKDFLLHPFQAVDIKLLGLEPISLIMDKIDLTISYGPVSDWDPSAAIYIRSLQKSMCSAYIEVQGTDDHLQVHGRLYFCFESIPEKCINDELILKSFARFNEDCWKNITKLKGELESPTVNIDTSASHSEMLRNVNPEQVPCTANLSETKLDYGGFKMMFINPTDGKVVAESILTEDNAEVFSSMDRKSQLQNKTMSTKELPNSKSVPECNSVEKTSETDVQLLTQKHFQKLLNKKKHQNTVNNSNTDKANKKNLQTIGMNKNVIKNLTNLCENSCSVPVTNEINSQTIISSPRIVNSSINETKNNLESSAVNLGSSLYDENVQRHKCNLNDRMQNQNESIEAYNKKPDQLFSSLSNALSDVISKKEEESKVNLEKESELNSLSSYESNVLKNAVSKTEEKPKTENMTEAELIAHKRLMKLQKLVAKRKSLSPVKASNMNCSITQISPQVPATETNTQVNPSADIKEKLIDVAVATNNETRNVSPNKMEISHDYFSDSSNQSYQSLPSDETVESVESFSKKETGSVAMSENLKQLQKLQKKVRLKNKKKSLLEESSCEINQMEELSVITTFDSSSCDCDSGLNSFSSSPSTSDRIE